MKTDGFAMYLLGAAINRPGFRILLIGGHYRSVVQIIRDVVDKAGEMNQLFEARFCGDECRIEFPNDSKIFGIPNNESRIAGYKPNVVISYFFTPASIMEATTKIGAEYMELH